MLAQGRTRAVTEIERILGYAFRSQSLLAEALTHSSYPDHRSYHRLEFVGDAALSLAITEHLYLTNPDLGPGPLTSPPKSSPASPSATASTVSSAATHMHSIKWYSRRLTPRRFRLGAIKASHASPFPLIGVRFHELSDDGAGGRNWVGSVRRKHRQSPQSVGRHRGVHRRRHLRRLQFRS
ncbi:unnamed protein product [Musa textilis]